MDYFAAVAGEPGTNALPTNPCRLLDFQRLVLADGVTHEEATGDREALLVLFGGRGDVVAAGKTFLGVGKRANPFVGLPHAVYLPAGTDYAVTGRGSLDAGVCSAPSDLHTEPYLIEPSDVTSNRFGAANFGRELRNILTAADQPGRPARRLIVGETLVPSGNWSTYPPHRHEVDDLPRQAAHEEMYYFRVNTPEGFGLARHYSPERAYDTTYAVKDSTILMVPHGYHTTCSAPGYTNYFLWFLAGEHRIQGVELDPDLAWVQKTVPMLV